MDEGVDTGPGRPLDPESLGDHLDRLYRAAWALTGSREDAEDLVQETYLRVLSRPRLLRSDDDLGYLLRTLKNTYLTSLRTASRRPQTAPIPEDFEIADSRNGSRPEVAIEANELYGAIAKLPDQFREAVVAVDVVGLSYREAAKALGTREATIASRVFRAREALAQRLGDEQPHKPKPGVRGG
jgi:RNA polymerase sigma-70 factor (ECF subfamily)